MKNRWKRNPLVRIVVLLVALVLIGAASGIGLFYYAFSIPEPEGLSLAAWPNRFTENFSTWIQNEDGTITIEDTGLERLDEYGLWLQVVDESGQEIFSHNKPSDYPSNYLASELVELAASGYENGNTVFVSSYEDSGHTWNYIVGFPYAIGKYMLYYNGETVSRLSPMFRMVILILIFVGSSLFLIYGFWLTRQMGKISRGIGAVSLRTYQKLPEKGIFNGIYAALNRMDAEIRQSDQLKKETEHARQEWIANITHDLKTPLSPIKGYAELLARGTANDSQTVQEYGSIILKNVDYVEKLINDLKLTYQLESGALPFHPEQVRLVRYLKELVIDIVNDPAFSNRNIEFECDLPEITAIIDPALFHRAVCNLVVNALVHNPPDTTVTVSVSEDKERDIFISVRDNGAGISEEEQAKLFTRYYRGTNTKEKSEGSGLGLAIAKQIIALHGGDIAVKSKLGDGTEFSIQIPAN
ncbi:sensor histidine kinase [Frisingicoccus sp.]|uniref:sensor histidine kinase n=1 Tax=Frisingicoccus sp. TaxID=1918627 RepID=UPI003AB77F8B